MNAFHEDPGLPEDPCAVPIAELDAALQRLSEAKPFARPRYQPDVLRGASELLDSASGLRALYDRAGSFEDVGVFHGGPWAEAASLQPQFVSACLRGDSGTATLEALSELRFLAVATGRASSTEISEQSARRFLRDVVAVNLDLLFPRPSDPNSSTSALTDRARRLFALIGAELSLDGLRVEVTEEVLDLAAQRPIVTTRVKKLIALASNLPPAAPQELSPDALELFQGCIHGPSPMARQHPDAASYRAALLAASDEQLDQEAADFGTSLRETGVVHPHHAVLLRRLVQRAPTQLGEALGLDAAGRAELQRHAEYIAQLINAVIVPSTSDAVLGMALVLERGILSTPDVRAGLKALIELDVLANVERDLLASRPQAAGLTANAVLASGAISVLGQPLGIGQGQNPTCQAARAISLWAAHAPQLLLTKLAAAARRGAVQAEFEGEAFLSSEASEAPLEAPDLALDPVQIVLVPHLNRIYDTMIARTGLRSVDSHKWVNPAMYGHWVPRGFACCVDPATMQIAGYDDFLSMFLATHHPAFNEGAALAYPNPVGLLVTDGKGAYMGPHAVAIQRVAADPGGEPRVYFFNPNNDGRQRWAPDITPTVRGFDELPGESSLPIEQFASRLYAFHYDPYQQGDAYAVPPEMLEAVRQHVRNSWAPAFQWRGARP